MSTWDPTADSWAAGFIDGEGCFVITRSAGGRSTSLVPRFALGLRADEAPVLRQLAEAFGGSISFSPASRGSQPRTTWTIGSKADLRRLVDYLDAHPLRAKKARDYAVWREAVELFEAARRAPDVEQEMRTLQQALGQAREYVDVLHIVEAGPSHVAVARRAGVDPSTVSRAEREPEKVAPATRERIAVARAELLAEHGPRLRLVG